MLAFFNNLSLANWVIIILTLFAIRGIFLSCNSSINRNPIAPEAGKPAPPRPPPKPKRKRNKRR